MLIQLTNEDILAAPQSVRDFLATRMGVTAGSMTTVYQAAPEASSTSDPAEPAMAEKDAVDRVIDKKALRQTIKERATALAESKGMEVLGPIVKGLGIPKITECPDEKLDDLLAALAVA